MIPPGYADGPCYYQDSSDPKLRREHEGHRNHRDCYLMTWDEAPLRWVLRRTKTWHLAFGIRKDSGHVQTHCNIGGGPGPFKWREKPVLNFRREPGQWFCKRCVAEWTKEVDQVTVDIKGVTVTKGQLKRLVEAIGGTDLQDIELRPTAVGNKPGLLAITTRSDQREEYEEQYLVIGDGVVRL